MKIDKLKKVIQKANPEIMELKFGCEVECNYKWKDKYEYFGLGKRGFVLNDDVTLIDVYLEPNQLQSGHRAVKTSFIFYNKDKFKILGRPITLADVLIACGEEKEVNIWNFRNNEALIRIPGNNCVWNLKENLDGQSDETLKFLTDILVDTN